MQHNTVILRPPLMPFLFLLLLLYAPLRLAVAQDLGELDNKIAQIAEQHGLPSVAYALVFPNKTQHIRTIGFANLARQQPATHHTNYRIASVSKMIVGIAIMQLVDSRQISLDDNIHSLLPDFVFENAWHTTHPLKLKHLVENTTGWDDMSLREFAFDNSAGISLVDALSVNPKSRVSRWPPGSRHAYTNTAAAVAAHIVERVTGMSFSSYAKQYIFGPLGIKRASFENQPNNIATGYDKRQQPSHYKPVLMSYAGNLTMNIGDMALLLNAMIMRNSDLFKTEQYARIEQSLTTNVGRFRSGYGVFNHARFYDNWRYRGHDGAFRGWRSELSYSPAHKFGFVVLQNSENDIAFRAIVKVIHTALTVTSETTTRDTRQETAQYAVGNTVAMHHNKKETSAKMPSALEGYYRYYNPRNQVRWFLERLITPYTLHNTPTHSEFASAVIPGWKRELHFRDKEQFTNKKGHVVATFSRDPILGDVLHYGDRVFKKITAFDAWADKTILIVWLMLGAILIPLSFVWITRVAKGQCKSLNQRNLYLSMVCCVFSAWVFLLFLGFGLLAPIPRLGSPTVVSIGMMISSILLVPTALVALWQLLSNKATFNHATTKVISLIFGVANALVVLYLGWFGVIGMRTWA